MTVAATAAGEQRSGAQEHVDVLIVGAGIAGLWYLEALGVPAATADGMTADMGNGEDLYRGGPASPTGGATP